MGSILINVPDIPDADLVYNENETRQILKFFWPSESATIDGLAIDNHARQLAQIAIVAAIEGTYAMGFIKDTFNGITSRNINISAFAKKLAHKFTHHWWKHTQKQDLDDVRIYESVRASVAQNLKHKLSDIYNGVALRNGIGPFFAQKSSYIVWA